MYKKYMEEAIKIMKIGIKKGQTPFGAVIVRNGKIISKAHNTVAKDNDPTAHAEVNAIRKAGKKLKTFDLDGCIIFSTCEPCPMCFSAIHWANINTIVYGADIKDAKSVGFREMPISNKTMNRLGKCKIKIIKHVLKEKCSKIMKEWGEKKDRVLY